MEMTLKPKLTNYMPEAWAKPASSFYTQEEADNQLINIKSKLSSAWVWAKE